MQDRGPTPYVSNPPRIQIAPLVCVVVLEVPLRRKHLRPLLIRNQNLLHRILLALEVVEVEIGVAGQKYLYYSVSF